MATRTSNFPVTLRRKGCEIPKRLSIVFEPSIFLLVISVVFVVMAAGCAEPAGSSGHEDLAGPQDAAKSQQIIEFVDIATVRQHPGKRNFDHYCSLCHGESGQGDGFNAWNLDPRPSDLTDPEFLSTTDDQDLLDVISRGSASAGRSNLCPPWAPTLNEKQIRTIVAYIRLLSVQKMSLKETD